MATAIRVLIAEDRQDDAELMVFELVQSGFDPKWKRVETKEDYLAELQTVPDVILADHTLPQFGVPQALKLLKEYGLDIPLLVVVGSTSEEDAIERMKQGAADYIVKDKMTRLGPAVKRALAEKKLRDKEREAEEQIRRNLERIRALHEINIAITSTLDIRTVLNVLLEKVDLFLPSAITVRLLNRETGALESLACRNLNEEKWTAQENTKRSGRARTVVDTKTPLIVRNVQIDPRTHNPRVYIDYGLVSYAGVPLIAKDEVLGVLGIYTKEEHDVTKEEIEFLMTLARQAAVAIHNAQLYEKLERANHVKDEFLKLMSHELRTPLNVIIGYTGMLVDKLIGEISEEQQKVLGKVMVHSSALLAMIKGIIEASRIEAGGAKVRSSKFHLADFLDDIQLAYQNTNAVAGKEVVLNWDYPSDLPLIETDGEKLELIIQNLLSNAIKFTANGSVTLSVRHLLEKSEVEFKITDTGEGIAKESFPTIFQMFQQVDNSETRSYGGLGLGLYIVKAFTELLGGKIEVESELGSGSVFTVTLPVKNDIHKDLIKENKNSSNTRSL